MKKLFALVLLILNISIISYVKGENLDLIGKVIYIDPGHGGIDPGATYKDIYEKDINLSIALKLKKELENNGAIVYLTRYDDIDLSISTNNHKKSDLNNRVRAINNSNADLFISIHLNSYGTSWHGVQIFYDDNNSTNEVLASIMDKNIKNLNGNRTYKKKNNLYLLKNIKIPGILVEVGFLSNENERYLLTNSKYQEKVSKSLCNGIKEYLK
ncbi:MAG: N-acetylmuramoyl-L-alanine amidase [Bacillales bacterium]|nr:N-acetylmuramoyl-L-alanine amidase [Bacillales bacterium]